jgi:hypothetical protein
VTVSDLNGVEFNPGEIVIDDIVGYVGYVRNLCTDLGTPKDTEEGYKDFMDFQSEIQSAHISTFEPDIVDVSYSFENIDLTGSKDPIREYPVMAYNACIGNELFRCYENYVMPFNLPDTRYVKSDKFVTPYEIDGMVELINKINEDSEIELK